MKHVYLLKATTLTLHLWKEMPLQYEFFMLWCSSEAVQNFFRQDIEMRSLATAPATATDFTYMLFFYLRSLRWKLVGSSFCLVHTQGSTCCSLMGIPGFSSVFFLPVICASAGGRKTEIYVCNSERSQLETTACSRKMKNQCDLQSRLPTIKAEVVPQIPSWNSTLWI